MFVTFRQIKLILPPINYHNCEPSKKGGGWKKEGVAKSSGISSKPFKTVDGNVGKWEGGSARMWESFEFLI